MKSKYCEVAWCDGVGIKEITDDRACAVPCAKPILGVTQFLELMDQLVLSNADIIGVQKTGACC